MSFHVRVHPQAADDVDVILTWLSERSREGARRWYESWLGVLRSLEMSVSEYELAPEVEGRHRDVRQTFFKTRRGRNYRVLFTLHEETVIILHVRGPGQDMLNPDDIREP